MKHIKTNISTSTIRDQDKEINKAAVLIYIRVYLCQKTRGLPEWSVAEIGEYLKQGRDLVFRDTGDEK